MALSKQATEGKDYGMSTLKDGSMFFKYEPWMREEDFPPPVDFPKAGLPEEEVLRMVKDRAAKNIPPQRFLVVGATYPDAHPFAKKVYTMPEVMNTLQAALARRLIRQLMRCPQNALD
jgi:hypothetical protein